MNGVWTRHVIDDAVGPAIQFKMVPGLFGDGRGRGRREPYPNHGRRPRPMGVSGIFVHKASGSQAALDTRPNLSETSYQNRARIRLHTIFDHGDVDGDGDIVCWSQAMATAASFYCSKTKLSRLGYSTTTVPQAAQSISVT